jgi:hypothetical protein
MYIRNTIILDNTNFYQAFKRRVQHWERIDPMCLCILFGGFSEILYRYFHGVFSLEADSPSAEFITVFTWIHVL